MSDPKPGALQQFVGATITAIRKRRDSLVLEVKMPEGSWHPDRALEAYTLGTERIFIRIDGMYVPEEEA